MPGALGDPYTEYYDEEATQALLETTSGEFSGIGATMSKGVDGGEITIVNVYKDSPADKAGLQEGDILYQVDGRETARAGSGHGGILDQGRERQQT